MIDLFTHADKYPHGGGWKKRETSRRAAEDISKKSSFIRDRVLKSLKEDGPATFYEMADRLGMDSRSVQPRFSELFALGLTIEAAHKRPSPYGKMITVWRAREACYLNQPERPNPNAVG